MLQDRQSPILPFPKYTLIHFVPCIRPSLLLQVPRRCGQRHQYIQIPLYIAVSGIGGRPLSKVVGRITR